MTEAEALEEVIGFMAGTIIEVPEEVPWPVALGRANAEKLVRMLDSAGWSWVRRER